MSTELLKRLQDKDAKHQGEIAPGVHVYAAKRPINRIRAYSSAGLTPFAARGAPNELLLLGHVHLDAEGRVARIEGFNGAEGERWAKQAHEKAASEGALAEGAEVTPLMPLRHCPHTGVR